MKAKDLRCTWCGGELRIEDPHGEGEEIICAEPTCGARWDANGDAITDDLGHWVH